MLARSVLYQIRLDTSGWWFVLRNARLVLAWRDLIGAVEIATLMAEFEAIRGNSAVKVVYDGGDACLAASLRRMI